MYISKITIRNFRIFDEIGITAFFKKGVNAIISENNCGKTAIIDAMRIAFSTVPYKKDIYFNLSDFHVRNDGVRSDEAFISVYFDEISPDFFEIWDPENPSKGEFHIRYYTIKTPEGKEKIRYNIWGGPVEGNPVSADIFEAIQLVFLGALRDAETEMRPSRSSKLASLFSTATNTDEAKEEIINVLRMANSEILKRDSLIRVGHIVNDNLSTIEQDVLKQSIELGLVEPRFEAIAGALRAWIKPRWVYLRKDHSEFQMLKDSYSEEEWTKNTSEDETGAYLGVCPKFCVNSVEWWKTEQIFLGRQRRRPLPPCLQHNAGGDGCQGRRLCAVHQSAVFQAARRPLTSGTVGVIPAYGRRNRPPFGRGSYSSPGVGLSTFS